MLSDFQKSDENRTLWASHPVCGQSASMKPQSWTHCAGGVSDRTESMSMCWVRSGWGEGHDGRVELRRSRKEGLAMPLQAVLTAFSKAAEIMHIRLQGDCEKIELSFLSGRAFRWMKAEMHIQILIHLC